MDAAEVLNNDRESRFESRIGEKMAFLTYRRSAQEIAFMHAEVPAELEGHGIGSHVVHAALEFAREQGLAVVPQCPFVTWYIRQHQEYAGLVRPDYRARITLHV
jgi:predicted GNAT family acetyltransferase